MPRRRSSSLLALLLSLSACAALSACTGQPASGPAPDAGSSAAAPAASATSAAAPAASAGAAERLDALLAAEQRRAAVEVSPADQQSRDVRVRRAAARALARIGGDAARPGLARALADEDDEVVAWAAYGLGFSCKEREAETVSALVARALARDAGPSPAGTSSGAPAAVSSGAPAAASSGAPAVASSGAPAAASSGGAPAGATPLDAGGAIARAIGRCGAETSEPTLVAWLDGPRERAIHAAYALGDLAAIKLKLREETLVALLNLASGSAASPPVPEALYPIGRLEHVPLTVIPRIRDVATARLAEASDARLFAVRALGRAGEAAASELARVLSAKGVFTAGERAEAARALKRLGPPGQRALADAVAALAPSADPIALTGLVSEDFGVLVTALDALTSAGAARKALRDLAALPPPPSAPAAILRRVAWLRCGAARLLVGGDYRDPLLLGCDVTAPAEPGSKPDAGAPVRGSIGARAVVEVIGRDAIAGARLAAFRAYAASGDLRAREAAIELIASHEEIAGAPDLLAKALAAEEPGLVATAAEVIARQPQRASEAPAQAKRRRRKRSDEKDALAAVTPPAIEGALLSILDRPGARDDPELIGAVVDAVGALSLKPAEARLEQLCRSSYPTTRARAGTALGVLRGRKIACDAGLPGDAGAAGRPAVAPPAGELPAEASALAREPAVLIFDTDAGELTMTLDPSLAPVAVTRFLDLARSGYYDGKIVHRVVPGFVTQFGAPFGDGAGGPPGKPALRCETSPVAFGPLRVGVALAGRDTGSSQLFVMHARAPHLDGQYAAVGLASGPWVALADGDVIRSVKVRD
ncbi:peptidylprolyl isomerase [Sorangium sp. So ce1000]|uniref:peptidylprolyl isomerase n=1 Tax=Sorangium sp. So ce1000 TaxID=3133325 RepID=UPI003F60ABB4